MIADRVRMQAYTRAMRESIRPGSVVLDIGTGTGVLALLACKFGARRVFAIEPSDTIQLARDLAAANGFADRIEFMQALSTEVDVPERADVIVSDLRGVLPLHDGHLPSIVDARERLLAPGGTLIPRSDTLWVALVQSPRQHARIASPWMEDFEGLDMRAGAALVANQWWRADVGADELMSQPRCCASIDYGTVRSADLDARATLVADRRGTTHGFCMWFDAVLAEGVGYSNAPGRDPLVYGRAFFPWRQPVELEPGDEVRLDLEALHTGREYLWHWKSEFRGAGGQARAGFRQSTFLGQPLSPRQLKAQMPAHVPGLGDAGAADARILQWMGEGKSLGAIALLAHREFTARFPGEREAASHVALLASKYGR
ncbi:50S ribosomal protein L11 methyltransferase [Caenimonas aquaedulcis]|uniref:50S ribosomal protein L11 methyltransferase n=1 Tax=Caenimonas aquaedulcis TaxID=2793270 RepID=A0A931H5N6_9BURK|nr:50S ribosomal protein L11 methyltransferase [Caenimonas aquaedulcis]MBG9389084.1 50S ribosomal protein L11 methyltransferase [Caenimonas aquaedulcis]